MEPTTGRSMTPAVLRTVALAGLLPLAIAAAFWRFTDAEPFMNESVHATIESAGGAISVTVALLLWLRLRDDMAPRYFLWGCLALVCMGTIDAAHGALSFGTAWSWMRHVATLVGGILFACTWLPVPGGLWRRRRVILFGALVASVAGAALICHFAESLPEPFIHAGYSTWVKVVNAVGGIGFILGTVSFLRNFRGRRDTDDLYFAGHTLMFGVAGLLFGVRPAWSAMWWMWHGFRFVAYVVVARAAYRTIAQLNQELIHRKENLESEVVLRTEALRRSESRLSTILEHLRGGVIVCTEDGYVIYWNPAALKMHGYTRLEEARAPLPNFQHVFELSEGKRVLPIEEWPMPRILRGGALHNLELRLRRFDQGWERIVSYSGAHVETPTGERLVFISVYDLTEQRAAEAELREREAVLSTVTAEARVGLVMVNEERRYVFANETYATILGLPHKNIVGQRVPEVLASVYDEIKPKLDRAFDGERITYELRIPRDAEVRFYEVTYEPRVGSQGRYVVVVISDVTERKRAQEILERTVAERTAQLRETIAQLETFSYSITHDMRGPLRAMNSFAYVLQEEAREKLSEHEQGYLRRIMDGSSRMDRLIQDVLQYSKLSREELGLEPVDLAQAVRDVLEQYSDISQHRQHVRLGRFCSVAMVRANPAALTQVISNLLVNALKFMPAGKTPDVRVECEERGSNIRITIADNGIGIAPEHQQRIFGVFERLHTTAYSGTGIGLSIVKKAVERMNGTIGVESTPDVGSRFWVELPKA